MTLLDTTVWHAWKHHRRVLPELIATRYLRNVVQGMAWLHGLSIWDADVGMGNMLVGRPPEGGFEPSVRIADLGGATCAHDMLRLTDAAITTEYVRSPDVFLGVQELSPAIDVWAPGIVSVALLCGSKFLFLIGDQGPAELIL